MELNGPDAFVLKENLERLREIGFEIEGFGGTSFLIRSVPAQLVRAPAKEIVLDIVSELKGFERSISVEEKRDALLKLVACHGAVRAGDALSREEMAGLLKKIDATPNAGTCPHGRPTFVRFSRPDIDRMFKR